ncbi:MAG TPA: hypothetical protein VLZ05_04705 [Mycobacterium sp.]|nr:hypothetical protein [Mycobacterium sp.]HUH68227.1 hypothetical protein [Mycobacterium sp.]
MLEQEALATGLALHIALAEGSAIAAVSQAEWSAVSMASTAHRPGWSTGV